MGAPSYLHDMGPAEHQGWPGCFSGAGSRPVSGCCCRQQSCCLTGLLGACIPVSSQVPPGSPKPMLSAAGRGAGTQVVAQKALSSSDRGKAPQRGGCLESLARCSHAKGPRSKNRGESAGLEPGANVWPQSEASCVRADSSLPAEQEKSQLCVWVPTCAGPLPTTDPSGTSRRSVPPALGALTTFFTGCRRTLFIFGLPVSPEGLRQSPSAITDCTSILKCEVAGKFTASQGPSGGAGSAAPSPRGCAGERAGCERTTRQAQPCGHLGAKGALGLYFNPSLVTFNKARASVVGEHSRAGPAGGRVAGAGGRALP